MSTRLLYLTVFVSRMTTLAVELTASHLLASLEDNIVQGYLK